MQQTTCGSRGRHEAGSLVLRQTSVQPTAKGEGRSQRSARECMRRLQWSNAGIHRRQWSSSCSVAIRQRRLLVTRPTLNPTPL